MERLYISLEGIDGIGKSTLANMLYADLSKQGYNAEILRPTKQSTDNHFTERIFAKHPVLHKSRFLRFFLFAHRSNYAASVIEDSSNLIIGDRSIITSYAYRWTKNRFINRLHILMVDLFEPKLPSPDYVIYCYAEYKQIANRLSGRKGLDIDENVARADWLVKAYEEILSDKSIKRLKSTKTMYLDCNGTIDATYANLMEIVKKILYDNKGRITYGS